MMITSLFMMCLLATACKRIPLFDPNGGVFLELHLDTDYKSDLSCEINVETDEEFRYKAYGNIPELVVVIVYDVNTHEQIYETIMPVTGGFLDLEPGTYDIVAYGKGADYTRLSNTRNRGLGRVYTENKLMLIDNSALQYGQFTVITQPDQIYAGRASEMVVPVRPEGSSVTRLHMELTPMVDTYYFIAYNISGLENVSSVNCYMTGQAPDRFLWDEHFTVQPVSVDFTAHKNEQSYSVKGIFNTFGKIPGYSAKAYMYVQIQTRSDKTYRWVYDVTDQFDNPDNTCHAIIVTDPIHIPDDGDSGTPDFAVKVQPWEIEIIDINVN
jgi:hypothetical protein